MVVKVPTRRKLGEVAISGLRGGIVGGLASAIGTSLGGPIGNIIAVCLAGSFLPTDEGKIVAVNGVMDSVVLMFIPR